MKKFICKHCQSANVKRDAFAMWDQEAQKWILESAYWDNAYCSECDGETTIVEIETEEAA